MDELGLCESPIERELGGFLRWYLEPIPQVEIEVDGGRCYRVDFAILLPGQAPIAIECDGHDYHERTKEQAKRDRRRDRDLMRAGWRVIRFTGSEIYANAVECVNEVLSIIAAEMIREEEAREVET